MVDQTSDDKTFQELDKEKIKQEIKTEAVEEAKQELVDNIQGKKTKYSWEERGEKQPRDYDELDRELNKDAVKPEDIDAKVEAKFKERDEAELKSQEEKRKQQAEQIEKSRQNFDNEWGELVQQGKMPKVAEDLQERINKGEKLTREEIDKDEGLAARLKLAGVVQHSGKSTKLAFYEDYDKQPAGAKAPVLGGRPSTPQTESKELTREEVVAERKRVYGY